MKDINAMHLICTVVREELLPSGIGFFFLVLFFFFGFPKQFTATYLFIFVETDCSMRNKGNSICMKGARVGLESKTFTFMLRPITRTS